MRIFKIPFNTKREEKILGGYLSLRQVVYLMLASSSLSFTFLNIAIYLKIILISVITIFFLLCAFLKIKEQNFDKLFLYFIMFLIREKKYVYERCCKW